MTGKRQMAVNGQDEHKKVECEFLPLRMAAMK